jgi:hypothetical protein
MHDHDKKLEEVRQSFAHWRTHKEFSSQAIPLELWHQAIGLMDFFSLARIAVALKVPIRSLEKQAVLLREEKQELSPSATGKQHPVSPSDQADLSSLSLNVTRIDLPSNIASENARDNELLTISQNGCLLRIPYDCPPALARAVVASFMGGFGS